MIKRWLLALSLILLALFLIGCTDDLLTGKAKGGGATTAKPQCSDGKDNDGDGRCDLLGCKIQRTNYLPDPGCTSILDNDETDPLPPPPVAFDFQISVPENYLSVVAGRSTSTIVKAVATNSGTPQLVTFSASDLPSGAAVSFDPASCTPFCANPAGCQVECPSTATYTTSSSTPSGFFVTRVEGTSGSLMHYYTVYLTVNTTNQTNQSVPPIPPPGNQTNQTNQSFSPSLECSDRLDNDGDGRCDYTLSQYPPYPFACLDESIPKDYDCMSPSDNQELADVPGPGLQPPPPELPPMPSPKEATFDCTGTAPYSETYSREFYSSAEEACRSSANGDCQNNCYLQAQAWCNGYCPVTSTVGYITILQHLSGVCTAQGPSSGVCTSSGSRTYRCSCTCCSGI